MTPPVRIIGSYLSPYVRKVLVALQLKGIPYEIDPIVAFLGDDRFAAMSPLRRIPVLIDDEVTLCDSSVICQYLEDRYPDPALFPKGIAERAKARWIEEYADTRVGDVLIWQLFDELAIGPYVWGRPTDAERVELARSREIPSVLDYLETLVPSEGYCFGELSIADVTIGAFFRNAMFVKYVIDDARWPKMAAYVGRVLATAPFAALAPFEKACMRAPPAKHRDVLAELGAPLWTESHATGTPRSGITRR